MVSFSHRGRSSSQSLSSFFPLPPCDSAGRNTHGSPREQPASIGKLNNSEWAQWEERSLMTGSSSQRLQTESLCQSDSGMPAVTQNEQAVSKTCISIHAKMTIPNQSVIWNNQVSWLDSFCILYHSMSSVKVQYVKYLNDVSSSLCHSSHVI